MDKYKGQNIYIGPLKYTWYSICSKHRDTITDCRLCMCGHYSNDIMHNTSSLIYKYFPTLWRYWANRPNSATSKRLRKWFPKLK